MTILYSIIRIFNLILAIIPSIAFYRATVQPEYKWGLLAIDGRGTSGDYWLLVIFLIFAWTTFCFANWYKRKWYYAFPILLFGTVFFVLFYGYVNQSEMVFQGDVWQFKFEMGLLFIIIFLALFLLTIIWTFMDFGAFRSSDLFFKPKDKIQLAVVVVFGGLILILFGQGRGGVHTIIDGIAVGLTVLQSVIFANLNDKTGKVE